MAEADAKWYVIHTYSGYENKVKANIEKTIANNDSLQEQILEVRVPIEEFEEIKNGKKKVSERKILPGYVLLKMDMNDDTWYVVRNTRGVTGFVGPGSKPVPLTDEEVDRLQGKKLSVDFAEGDTVAIVAGPMAGNEGVVRKIDMSRQTVTIMVGLFGESDTPVELGFSEIRKVDY